MTTRTKYFAATMAAALLCLAALTGCSQATSDSEVSRTLESALAKPVSHATSVSVGMGYDGPEQRTVSVRLYLDTSDDSVVTSSVDRALRTVWKTSPVRPSSIVVSVVEGPKPTDGTKGTGLDLTTAATALGIPVPEVARDLLLVRASVLQKRYGAR